MDNTCNDDNSFYSANLKLCTFDGSLQVEDGSEDRHRDQGFKSVHCVCYVYRGRQEVPLNDCSRVKRKFIRVFVGVYVFEGVDITLTGS